MNHYCNNSSCPEYNHGQCFGMGCSTNPMPMPSEPEDSENAQEDNQ